MRLAIGAAALGFASGAHALPVAAPTLVVDSTPPDAPGPAAAYVAGGALGVVELNADRVFLDWNSFDIANGETVEFQREGSTSWIALNRVVGGGSTTIDGILRSIIDIDDGVIGGSIWVINPSGVAFGANAVVDVGGLLVATSAPTPADFVGGDLTGGGLLFTGPAAGVISTAPTARIVAQGGVVAFIAPTLQIGGEITATNPTGGIGQVLYASAASAYTVQFAVDPASPGGWDLISYVVPAPGSDAGLIDHDAVTTAGQVIFSAPRNVISAVMNLDGVVDATNVVATNTGVLITGGNNAQPFFDLNDPNFSTYSDPGVTVNAGGLAIATSGDVEVRGGAITLGEINAGDDVRTFSSTLSLAGDVAAGGEIRLLVVAGDLDIGADVSANDRIVASSSQDVYIQSGVTVRGDADANGVSFTPAVSVAASRSIIAAADSLLASGSALTPFGTVDVGSGWDDGGDLTLGGVQAQQLSATARRDAANTFGGQVNVIGDVEVTDLYVIAGVNSGDGANIGVNANVNAAASATFIARNDINIAAGASISAGQAALVQADRDVSHLGVVVSGDYASIAAGRDISMGAGSVVRGDADGGGPLDPISSTVAYVQAARDLTMDAAALVAAGPDGAPSGGASVLAGGLWAGGFEGGGNLILGNVSAAYLNAGATRSADDAYGGSLSAIGNVFTTDYAVLFLSHWDGSTSATSVMTVSGSVISEGDVSLFNVNSTGGSMMIASGAEVRADADGDQLGILHIQTRQGLFAAADSLLAAGPAGGPGTSEVLIQTGVDSDGSLVGPIGGDLTLGLIEAQDLTASANGGALFIEAPVDASLSVSASASGRVHVNAQLATASASFTSFSDGVDINAAQVMDGNIAANGALDVTINQSIAVTGTADFTAGAGGIAVLAPVSAGGMFFNTVLGPIDVLQPLQSPGSMQFLSDLGSISFAANVIAGGAVLLTTGGDFSLADGVALQADSNGVHTDAATPDLFLAPGISLRLWASNITLGQGVVAGGVLQPNGEGTAHVSIVAGTATFGGNFISDARIWGRDVLVNARRDTGGMGGLLVLNESISAANLQILAVHNGAQLQLNADLWASGFLGLHSGSDIVVAPGVSLRGDSDGDGAGRIAGGIGSVGAAMRAWRDITMGAGSEIASGAATGAPTGQVMILNGTQASEIPPYSLGGDFVLGDISAETVTISASAGNGREGETTFLGDAYAGDQININAASIDVSAPGASIVSVGNLAINEGDVTRGVLVTGAGLISAGDTASISGALVDINADISAEQHIAVTGAGGVTLRAGRQLAAPSANIRAGDADPAVASIVIEAGAVVGLPGNVGDPLTGVSLSGEDIVLAGEVYGDTISVTARGSGAQSVGLIVGGADAAADAYAGAMTLAQSEFDNLNANTLYLSSAGPPLTTGDLIVRDLLIGERSAVTFVTGRDSVIHVAGAITPVGAGPGSLVFGGVGMLIPDSQVGPDAFMPGHIIVTGAIGGAQSFAHVSFSSFGDILIGSDAFIAALESGQDPTQGPVDVGFGGVPEGFIWLNAQQLRLAASGAILMQNTGSDALNGAGLSIANTEAQPVLFAGPEGAPRRVSLFGVILRDTDILGGIEAARAPGLTDSSLALSGLYRWNGCVIGSGGGCFSEPAPPIEQVLANEQQPVFVRSLAPVVDVQREEEESEALAVSVTGSGAVERWNAPGQGDRQ